MPCRVASSFSAVIGNVGRLVMSSDDKLSPAANKRLFSSSRSDGSSNGGRTARPSKATVTHVGSIGMSGQIAFPLAVRQLR